MKIDANNDPRPEEPTLSELIELARKEREALLAKRGGGKGSARIKLERQNDNLKKMLLDEQLPVATICDLLARTGTEVNLKSLFKYLREEMSEEYAEYLRVTQRGKRENRSLPEHVGPTLSGSVKQKDEAAPLEATDEVGRGKQRNETPATPAATGEGAPMQSSKQRADKAAAMVEQLLDSDD